MDKAQFRKSKEWWEFRKKMYEKDPYDFITGYNLHKGYNVHHIDQNEDHYTNLDESRFCLLNKQTHEMIHFLHKYYKNDPDIINRIRDLLDRMNKEYND